MPAPAELGSGMVRVPEGADLHLEVLLEDVSDGVLVTATVAAPLAGECARCLDEFTASTQVRFRELFAAEAGGSGDDGYLLDGDLLDLEPALRTRSCSTCRCPRCAAMIAQGCAAPAAYGWPTPGPTTVIRMTAAPGWC